MSAALSNVLTFPGPGAQQAKQPEVIVQIVDDDYLTGVNVIDEASQPDDTFDRNLADRFDSHSLAALASHLLESIESDIQSRREWEETANIAANYLGIKLEEPTTSVSTDGTVTKAISTAMLEAATKLWSTARAELLPGGGPIKVKRDPSQDPMAEQTDEERLAEALATDMNYFLTMTDKEYYPDFSHMLMNRCLIGLAFRKVYMCPLKRRPRSVWVKAVDLIVSNDCLHLSGASRVTERIRMPQATMQRLIAKGHYRDVALVRPTGIATPSEIATAEIQGIQPTAMLPDDFEHLVYECYTDLGSGTSAWVNGDLSRLEHDETGAKPGYPLPYRVSIDVDSREILEIRRGWKKGDEDHIRRPRYVKYGFLPQPMGGFYDLGLIHCVGNPTQVATMIGRASTDGALYSMFPAFAELKGPGSRSENTVYRPMPGESVKFGPVGGATDIRQILMKFPFEPPNAEAIGLMNKSEGDVRRLAGVIEIPVGEGRIGNVPVGTIMSYIEAIAQVPGAVHKDDHIAQAEEFDMLRGLFAENPALLIRGNRTPAKVWQVASEIMDPDIVPVADPNVPTRVHRLMNVQARVALGGLPQFAGIANQREIYRNANQVIGEEYPGQYELPEQDTGPPPPPKEIITAQIKSATEDKKIAANAANDQRDHAARMAELGVKAQISQADRESEETRAALQLQTARVKDQASQQRDLANREQADRHHADEMTNASADREARFAGPFAGGGSAGEDK